MSDSTPVPPERWGRDHFQVLGYAGHVAHSEHGAPDREKMRAADGSPMQTAMQRFLSQQWGKRYPTRLRGGDTLDDHDDWSCFEDLCAAGLLVNRGTGANPVWRLTKRGLPLWSHLVATYRSIGGWNAVTWEWLVSAVAEGDEEQEVHGE